MNSSKLIFVIFEVLVWISCIRSLNVVSVLYQKPGDFKCLLVENKETLLTNSGFSASNHPRRPRGCQLGRDKRRRKGYYSKQTSSTTYSNACLWLGTKHFFVPNRGPASIVLLSWSFLPAHSTVRCILPYLSGSCSGAFFEKIFQWEWGPKAEDTHNRNER